MPPKKFHKKANRPFPSPPSINFPSFESSREKFESSRDKKMNSLPFKRDKKKPSFQSQSSFPSSFENKIKDITPQKSSFPSSLGHSAPAFSSNIKKNRPSFSSSIEKNRPSFSSNIEKNRPVFKSTLDKKISTFATNPSDKKVTEMKNGVLVSNLYH